MNPIARRLAQIEAELSKKHAAHAVSPAAIRAINKIADRIREAALNPKHPGMVDVCRAYAGVFLPIAGQSVPSYEDGWMPGEAYWREFARIIKSTGLANCSQLSDAITKGLNADPAATAKALNAIDEQRHASSV